MGRIRPGILVQKTVICHIALRTELTSQRPPTRVPIATESATVQRIFAFSATRAPERCTDYGSTDDRWCGCERAPTDGVPHTNILSL